MPAIEGAAAPEGLNERHKAWNATRLATINPNIGLQPVDGFGHNVVLQLTGVATASASA